MKRKYELAAVTILVVAFATFAFAQAAQSTSAAGAPPNMTQSHAGKTGHLKLSAPMRVGEITLPADDYEVKVIESSAGEFVRFSRTIENDYAPEGMSVYEQQIVATVPTRDVPLNSKVRRTELLSASNGRISSLKIRGDNVEHVLGESAIRVAGTPSPQR